MKITKMVCLLFLSILISCSFPIDDKTEDVERLHSAIDQFYQGIESGNGDLVIELFAEEMVQMPNGRNMKVGKQNIEPGWRKGLEAGFQLKDVETKKLVVKGDITYKIAEYYGGMVEESKEVEWYRTKNIHIWEKDPEGNWKLTVDI